MRLYAWLNQARASLSMKLLLLTIAFVMIAEILILVPTLAKYRVDWLMDRLAAAQIAALALEAAPNRRLPQMLEEKLLRQTKVHSIAVKRADRRILALQADMPHIIDAQYEIAQGFSLTNIKDALAVVFWYRGNRYLRVSGRPEVGSNDIVEIIIEEAPLRAAMLGHLGRILLLSGFISLFTASLIYLALDRLLVRPMNRLTSNIIHFAQNPEDRSRVISPKPRNDIIGITERELANMQNQLADMLHQKTRLANLGLAVSKINHDLRNMLASSQLLSDRLTSIDDPTAQKLVPKLIHSLDRAIKLCSDTLQYGRAEEAAPQRQVFALKPLIEEIHEGLGLTENPSLRLENLVEDTITIDADRDQMYRILSNLIRNGVEAIEAQAAKRHDRDAKGYDSPAERPGIIRIQAKRMQHKTQIRVSDNGPGLPKRAREHLFQPFQGSQRKGGTGLGLAITAELVRAHGGTIVLAASDAQGTTFVITIPDHDSNNHLAGKKASQKAPRKAV